MEHGWTWMKFGSIGCLKFHPCSIFIHFPCTLDFWIFLIGVVCVLQVLRIFRRKIPAWFVVPPYFLDPPTWFSSSRVAMLRSASAVAFCLCNSLVHKIAEWPVNNKNMTLETLVKPIIVGLGRWFSHWIDLGDMQNRHVFYSNTWCSYRLFLSWQVCQRRSCNKS